MTKGYDFLGEKIKKLREINKCSQTELGNLLGLPKQSVSRIEKGNRKISTGELDKIASYFKLPKRFILQDGMIEDYYEKTIEGNKSTLKYPPFVDDFLFNLNETFNYSFDADSKRDVREIKKSIGYIKKALDEMSKEYEGNK